MGMIKPIRTRRGFQRAGKGLPTANVGKGTKWNTPFEVKNVNGMYLVKTDNSEANEIIYKHCQNPYRLKVMPKKQHLSVTIIGCSRKTKAEH